LNRPWVFSVKFPACHAGGRGFGPRHARQQFQLVSQRYECHHQMPEPRRKPVPRIVLNGRHLGRADYTIGMSESEISDKDGGELLRARLIPIGQLAKPYLRQTGRSSIGSCAEPCVERVFPCAGDVKREESTHDADILVEIDLIGILVGTCHRPVVVPDQSGSERVERHQDGKGTRPDA
jgi:hypothetical protein